MNERQALLVHRSSFIIPRFRTPARLPPHGCGQAAHRKMNIMTKTPPILANVLCAVALLVGASTTIAQDDRRFINSADVPAEAARAEDFAPRGWLIEERASGDLNRDGRPDTVIGLIEDLPNETDDGGSNPRQRALIVLFRAANNSFQRAAVAPRVLRCTGCGGMLSRPANTSSIIAIRNGVLVVTEGYGSREAVDYTLRFRHDAQANRFALIGVDVEKQDRLTGDGTSESTNYLTGARIIRTFRNNTRPVSTVRRRVQVERRFLEEFDAENYFDNY